MYILHPGYVISRTDGDRHYIGLGQLIRLYHLGPHEWVDGNNLCGIDTTGMVHLYPRYDGNYNLEKSDGKEGR